MYLGRYTENITKKILKLKKKDPNQYSILIKKIDQIRENPFHDYKDLRYDMKGQKRVHISHFVLTFEINHNSKTILFDDYDHHDRIYE